jgi:hypothetical protein
MPTLKLDKPRMRHKKIAPHNLPPKQIDYQSLLVKWTIAKTIIICSSRWTWVTPLIDIIYLENK